MGMNHAKVASRNYSLSIERESYASEEVGMLEGCSVHQFEDEACIAS